MTNLSHQILRIAALLVLPLPIIAAPKVGLVIKDRNLFWAAVEQGAMETAKTADIELITKAPSAASQPGQQLRLLNSLEKEPIVALLVGALSPDDMKSSLATFIAKGVKVVALDTALPDGCSHVYIGYNQKTIAETAAKLFIPLVKDGDEIAILRANSVETISLREKTLAASVKAALPKSNLHLDVKVGLEKDDDYKQSLVLLDHYPNIKGVITPFSASSMAMIKALKDRNLSGKVVHVGIGTGLPKEAEAAIASGVLQCWIAQQPKLMGSMAVNIAAALIQGKPTPASVDAEFLVVTKENLGDPKLAAIRVD